MSTTERMCREHYETLSARDKRLVLLWRDLGNSWSDSVINSGVLMSDGRRVRPHEAQRAQEDDRFEEMLLTRQQEFMWSSDGRRQACEHEAAHVVACKALELNVKLAVANADGSGSCLHKVGTPFETAVVAMAGEQWIGIFRSNVFLGGPTGCQYDRRTALESLPDSWERNRAHQLCYQILRDKQKLVLSIAKKIDRDGHYLP